MANDFDIIVIGSGPAGQKAAVQGAKAGKRVALIESDRYVGGHCVHKGTIPSKTLRENALRVSNLRHFSDLYSFNLREEIPMGSLISNLVQGHQVARPVHPETDREKQHRVYSRSGKLRRPAHRRDTQPWRRTLKHLRRQLHPGDRLLPEEGRWDSGGP